MACVNNTDGYNTSQDIPARHYPQRTCGYSNFYNTHAQHQEQEDYVTPIDMEDQTNHETREDKIFDMQIELGEVYQKMQNVDIDIDKRIEMFNEIKEQLRLGNITFARLASYHVHCCALQAMNFSVRPGIGVLDNNEKLLIPVLTFLREGLLMGDKTLADVANKSQLLPYLSKMVMTFAERTDLMTKNLSKMCALDTLLGYTQVIPPFETLKHLLEVTNIPDCFAKTNVAKQADLQHRYDCECIDCKELPAKPQPPLNNPFMLLSGKCGTILYPLRNLPRHIAAVCPVSDFWEMLEGRSKKIADAVAQITTTSPRSRNHDMNYRARTSQVFVPGQQVAVCTEFLDWISYEATSPTAPKLPKYLRGFVIGECPLPIPNPHIGLWLPDYAAQALCTADKLVVLPEFSNIRVLPPLLYLASACPATPDQAVEIAVELIFILLLKNARLDQIQILLDDKGPWKTVQLLRFLSGDYRVKLLSIINKITKDFERGSRAVVACCIHNHLADWLVWSVFTRRMSELEQETLVEGLIQTVPRIDVRKWPKRALLLQAVHALLRDSPDGNLRTLLMKCKDILSWDPTNRNRRGGPSGPVRPWQNRRPDYRERDNRERDYHEHRNREFHGPQDRDHDTQEKELRASESHEQVSRDDEERDDQGMLRRSEHNIGRRPRSGETWFNVVRATLSMVVPPSPVPIDGLSALRASIGTMIRNKLYKPAQQGVHCEIVNANSLRDVRQPLLARLMCGMLNSGGGQIYIGLGDHSLIQGVHAPRPERDSFTQGVLDVTTYSLDPRLLPFTFRLERRIVLKSHDHVPDGDWNRYVFILHLRPIPDTVYQVLPEKQSYVRRPPDGCTVCLAPKKYDTNDELVSKSPTN